MSANGVATDLTGYFVNSSKPIAILGGHACAFVPEGVFFCDHIVEQIRPVYDLGTEYFVPPIIGRDPDAGYEREPLSSGRPRRRG